MKRLTLRRLGLGLIVLSIVAMATIYLNSYRHLHLEVEADPELPDLPELKEENKSPDPVSPDIDEPTRKKLVQQVSFEEMRPFEDYDVTSGDTVVAQVSKGQIKEQKVDVEQHMLANATFFSLVRNGDFRGILHSIQSVEARFNSRYHYDWVFANEEPFDELFIKTVGNLVSGQAHFVQVPEEYWSHPEWIDMSKANRTKLYMKKKKIKYGDSDSYRHMCRFNSGFFYRLPVMQNYRYYWRVEPDIHFSCDLFQTDWFHYMHDNGLKYGFALAPLELHTTVTNLWQTTKSFMSEHPQYVDPNNSLDFVSDDGGDHYNMCHFWSNFEIGDMDFYRLEAYESLFNYFDRTGGFYYSRWGDAPVHSIAVAMLLSKDEVFHFQNSGYFHNPNGDCPRDASIRKQRKCGCSPRQEHTWSRSSCVPKWYEVAQLDKPRWGKEFRNQHKYVEGEEFDPFTDW